MPKASAVAPTTVRRPGMPRRRRRGSGAAALVLSFVNVIPCSQRSKGPMARLVREYTEMRRNRLTGILEPL
ncbi:envelope glycoprotein gp160 [Streptomyces laurentii]|uniref:Envelope glycoprotein gp160 n=1 Tax=Streptomyces laurentii TaxID=39478 RepID=A0A160NVI3_STRLU|nr:envelope glycoprotein gp160 [Streptomyces laurentii]